MQQPPHDTSLYDILQVSPNATLAQITKSYRRLSLKYHPDKISKDNLEDASEHLQQIRRAYEVLEVDTTRLPYHKYGLIDISLAVVLLTGPGRIHDNYHLVKDNPLQDELLKLMGYDKYAAASKQTKHHPSLRHRQRVLFIAARLVEQIRPLVEGTVEEGLVAFQVTDECDRLKTLPLGAQILRCIGRAYRHTGNDFLHKHKQGNNNQIIKTQLTTDLSLGMRQQYRQAKRYWTAALASGRVALTEQLWTQQEKQRQQRRQRKQKDPPLSIEYQELGELIDDDYNDVAFSDEEIKEAERLKAQQAVLQSLQVEALWKISKIDLDNTIQDACNTILNGDYFFFPSHQSSDLSEWNLNQGGDGWVSSSSGRTVDAHAARLRAAEAMKLIGEIMVRCSKEGTSWKE
jgi:curved DNA-binding protein CbpA